VSATLFPLCRGRRPSTRLAPNHCPPRACPVPASQANLTGVNAADGLLTARLAAGDDHALAEAFDQFGPAVYSAALRILGQSSAAQDVVQDVFVQLWRQPLRYDAEMGPLRTFLIVQARHRAVDMVRSEFRRIARQERHDRLAAGQTQPSACDEAAAAEAASAVRAAVERLPDGQRRVVELTYFEGLTCREVALVAGIPEGTAKSRLRLALAKLGSALDRQLLESS
jgi:RNA polymerase sigma-70 factor (ECF subfamily)